MNTLKRVLETAGPLETRAVGSALGRALDLGDRLFLSGDLGGGKTTFTRGILEGLDHPDPREVASPSFALHHRYIGGRLTVDHLDLYRTAGEHSLSRQGLLDPLEDPEAVCIVEWAERIAWWPEAPTVEITFVFLDADVRRLEFRFLGSRGEALARGLEAFPR